MGTRALLAHTVGHAQTSGQCKLYDVDVTVCHNANSTVMPVYSPSIRERCRDGTGLATSQTNR